MPARSTGKWAARALSRIAASVVFVASGFMPAQHIVGAKLDDQRVGVLRHRPVVARESVRGRVAGDAGVDDFDVPALGAKRRFEAVGKSLARRQAISGRQAVAQGHKAKRARRGGVRGRRQDRRERQRLDEEAQMPI